MKYCLGTNAIINIEFAGMLADLGRLASQNLLCISEGVLRELTDTATKIGEKVERWVKYGCFHYLSQDELALFVHINNRYGSPFRIGNAPTYKGFWATESGKRSVDAQVVAVAKHNGYIIVTNDSSIHGASYLENIECIRWEELCRRIKNSQPKLL